MPIRPKRLAFAAAIDRDGLLTAEGGAPVSARAPWTADHLLLAALVRCTLASLKYHARRAGLRASCAGSASGVVTRRDDDGRYAFVEIDCELEVEFEPHPPDDSVSSLLTAAERDCFVGASLVVTPRYRWRVNGRDA